MRISVKSLLDRQTISPKAPPEEPAAFRLENENGHIFLVWTTPPKTHLKCRREWSKSPELREPDGTIHWKTLMHHCKGFQRTANWTFDDLKTCLETGIHQIVLEYCLDEENQTHCMRSVQGHTGGRQIDPRLQNNVLIPHGMVGLHLSRGIIV